MFELGAHLLHSRCLWDYPGCGLRTISVRVVPLILILRILLEAENTLKSAPSSIPPLRAFIELEEELEEVCELSLLVTILLAELSF